MDKNYEKCKENTTNLFLKCMRYFCDLYFKYAPEKKNKKANKKS